MLNVIITSISSLHTVATITFIISAYLQAFDPTKSQSSQTICIPHAASAGSSLAEETLQAYSVVITYHWHVRGI